MSSSDLQKQALQKQKDEEDEQIKIFLNLYESMSGLRKRQSMDDLYKENFNRDRTSTSGDLDENGDGDGEGEGDDGMTPEERDALLKQGLVQGGGNVGLRGRKYHTTGSSRGTVLSPV